MNLCLWCGMWRLRTWNYFWISCTKVKSMWLMKIWTVFWLWLKDCKFVVSLQILRAIILIELQQIHYTVWIYFALFFLLVKNYKISKRVPMTGFLNTHFKSNRVSNWFIDMLKLKFPSRFGSTSCTSIPIMKISKFSFLKNLKRNDWQQIPYCAILIRFKF